MASAIDATKPVAGSPTTQSVRENFATAASEITALQSAIPAPGHIPGTQTNDSAAAGQVGEIISAVITTGVALPSGAVVVVGSISLTAGDWDVSGELWISGANTAAITEVAGAISTTTSLPAGPSLAESFVDLIPGALTQGVIFGLVPCRQLLAATTTINMLGYQSGGTGAPVAKGRIWARRAR
jgi:hypothetical protein